MGFAIEFYETEIGGNKEMKKTSFDNYLEQKLADPAFAKRYRQADEAWNVPLGIADARKLVGLSRKELGSELRSGK